MPASCFTDRVVSELIRPKHWIAASAVAGAVMLSSCGATVFAASSTSPSPAPTATAKAKAGAKGGGLLSRADHATLETKRNGKWVTVDMDRGNVTAATASSITLNRPDGQSVTLQLLSSTKFGGKEATSASALKTGVRAVVISENGSAISVREGTKPLPAH